jgi:hypothetical protein
MEEADTWDEKIIRHLRLHLAHRQWGGGEGVMNRSFSNKPTISNSVVDSYSLIRHFK